MPDNIPGGRFELPTSSSTDWRSNQLSYPGIPENRLELIPKLTAGQVDSIQTDSLRARAVAAPPTFPDAALEDISISSRQKRPVVEPARNPQRQLTAATVSTSGTRITGSYHVPAASELPLNVINTDSAVLLKELPESGIYIGGDSVRFEFL